MESCNMRKIIALLFKKNGLMNKFTINDWNEIRRLGRIGLKSYYCVYVVLFSSRCDINGQFLIDFRRILSIISLKYLVEAGIYDNFVQNLQNDTKRGIRKYINYYVKQINIFTFFGYAFKWECTQEGFEFWKTHEQNLNKYINNFFFNENE